MSARPFDEVRALLRKGELELAVERLEPLLKEYAARHHDEYTIQAGRLASLQKRRRTGLLTDEAATVECNRFASDLLSFLDVIRREQSSNSTITALHSRGPSRVLVAEIKSRSLSEFAKVRLVGFPARAATNRVSITIADVYVPTDLSEDPPRTEGMSEVESLVIEIKNWISPTLSCRIIVLGDPGSGKSMLLRSTAYEASGNETARVPFLFSLRQYIHLNSSDGPFEYLAKEYHVRFALHIAPSDIEEIAIAGQLLLLLDGLDEVTDEPERERVRSMIANLVDEYPKISIVATSRIVGYEACSFDRNIFKHRRLERFSETQRSDYLQRWYRATESDELQALQRSAELLKALKDEPRAADLARNPLLATLVALVHRQEAQLPTRRAQLFEECFHLLTTTWPGSSGRRFLEIESERQRQLLQDVALHIQESRINDRVSIGRSALEQYLLSRYAARLRDPEAATTARSVIEGWVKWLAAGSGVLVEEAPGIFAFIHMSIMEYLAGRAFLAKELARGNEQVASEVVAKLSKFGNRWSESLVLMLGSEQLPDGLVDTVVERHLTLNEHHRLGFSEYAEFGLRVLRDDIDISPVLRRKILERAARAAIQDGRYSNVVDLLEQIIAHSTHHADALKMWYREQLTTACGEQLVGAIMLCDTIADETNLVTDRVDVSARAADVLDTVPLTAWGMFFRHITPALGYLRWARGLHPKHIYSRVLFATSALQPSLLERQALAVALPFRLLASTVDASIAAYHVGFLEESDSSTRRPLWHLESPLNCYASEPIVADGIKWHSALNFQALTERYGFDVIDSRSLTDESLALRLALIIFRHRSCLIDRQHSIGMSNYERAEDSDQPYEIVVARQMTSVALGKRRFDGDIVIETVRSLISVNPSRQLRRPPNEQAVSPWETYLENTSKEGMSRAYGRLILPSCLDAARELRRSGDLSARLMNADLLLENRFVLMMFDVMCEAHDTSDWSPELHALFLSLGLAQYQTTWQWPWGKHWQTWFAAEPPTDWLPRTLWHLCWMVGDPAHVGHRERALAALQETNTPELASFLRERILALDCKPED